MFNGSNSVTIVSDKPAPEVKKYIIEALEGIGDVEINTNGAISIRTTKFNAFATTAEITGRLKERDNKYTIEIDFSAKLEAVGWIIAICFFPLGCAVLIFPNNAKGAMERKIDSALTDIKTEFKM
jgi:hypothetical protein